MKSIDVARLVVQEFKKTHPTLYIFSGSGANLSDLERYGGSFVVIEFGSGTELYVEASDKDLLLLVFERLLQLLDEVDAINLKKSTVRFELKRVVVWSPQPFGGRTTFAEAYGL